MKKMFGYKVSIDHEVYFSESSDEEYGSWSEECSNSFDKIEKTEKYPDVSSVQDIKQGEMCFVVWAEWSSGDSFGSSSKGCKEAIAVFTNSVDAFGLMNAIKNPKKSGKYDDSQAYSFTASTGQEYESSCPPWAGYFESLDSVKIEHVMMY